jgi:plastocyanin
MATANHQATIHSKHARPGGSWWLLLFLAALSPVSSADGPISQTAAAQETMTSAGRETQSPARDQKPAAVETRQGTPVGFTGTSSLQSSHTDKVTGTLNDNDGNTINRESNEVTVNVSGQQQP